MTETISSTRFGQLSVPADSVIDIPAGLVGLPGRRYAFVPTGEDSPFYWLQSAEDPALALPVCDPFSFFADFVLDLSDETVADAGLPADGGEVAVWVTVRASGELRDFAANLAGPIVVHGGVGHQVVNVHPDASVRRPLFGDVAADAA